MSLSQYKSKIRQLESKQRQAINSHNQKVRKHNQNVKQSVNKYNQNVRNYNARVRANRQRLKLELNKLNQRQTTRYVTYRSSVISLSQSYSHLDQRSEAGNLESKYNPFLDLSEKETANSAEILNLLNGSSDYASTEGLVADSVLENELRGISDDLDDRWKGAVFSLHPNNPDAARHFCTSAREIFTQILEIKAPDVEVMTISPDCDITDHGTPTRRSKIRFLLNKKDLADTGFEDFVEEDIQNIIELFQIFNDGTHGSAGKFSFHQLSAIKKRVEDSIIFLSKLVN